MADKKKIFDTVKYWLVLNVGTLALAAGVYFFKSPNHFATGGVSGLSIILATKHKTGRKAVFHIGIRRIRVAVFGLFVFGG